MRVLPGESVGVGPSITDDGSVIVGTVRNEAGNAVAVVWTDGILKEVGEVEAGNWANGASDVSGDGRIVLGYEHSANLGIDVALMWNADNGYVPVIFNTLVDDAVGFNMADARDVLLKNWAM